MKALPERGQIQKERCVPVLGCPILQKRWIVQNLQILQRDWIAQNHRSSRDER
ncbi:MAG: hypothetical protein WCX75_08390 [Fibrobacteraceae bacterium]